MTVTLDKRLALCASEVGGDYVCDIGTDHAYLPAELVLSGKCSRAVAADIGKGPLAAARQTLVKYGVSDRVKTVLSDGLCDIDTAGVTDIVIAGMGGELIADILRRGYGLGKFDGNVSLILQPMTRASYLRRFLCSEGYDSISEKAAVDGRFCYAVIKARTGGIKRECGDVSAEAGFGDINDPDVRAYIAAQYRRLKAAADGKQRSGNADAAAEIMLCRRIAGRLGTEDMIW